MCEAGDAYRYASADGKETSEKTVDVYKNAVKKFYQGVTDEEMEGYRSTLEKVKANVLKLLEESSGSEDAEQKGEKTTCLSLQDI